MVRQMQITTTREERGLEIANVEGQIKRVDDFTYKVKSQSKKDFYNLKSTEIGWKCSCPDHVCRGAKCKHIWAVEFSSAIRKQVERVRIEPIVNVNPTECVFCGSSSIVKDGLRHNKYGNIQIFYCKGCSQHFTANLGFEGMKNNSKIVTTAMQLYFSGESFRGVAKSLKLLNVKVSHVAVYKWIEKYTNLMKQYVEQIKPQVSDTWRADEL